MKNRFKKILKLALVCSLFALTSCEAEKDFILLDKTSATKFTAELERGMRHYFQLVAENSAQTSLHSSSVHLDVEGSLPS